MKMIASWDFCQRLNQQLKIKTFYSISCKSVSSSTIKKMKTCLSHKAYLDLAILFFLPFRPFQFKHRQPNCGPTHQQCCSNGNRSNLKYVFEKHLMYFVALTKVICN